MQDYQVATTERLDIAYLEWNRQGARTAILLHGWPDSPECWKAVAPILADAGYRVLAPALLEVEDDGPGIPPEERERVFERFYRRNPHAGGAGLGLAIVGEICRAHRAEIKLGQGALGGLRVQVSFPPAC